MKHEPTSATQSGKFTINSFCDSISWWDRVSGDLQGGANSVSQVDGVSDIAPTCQLCGSLGEGSEKG